MSDLSTRLQNARITMLLDFPWFGQLAMRLAPEIDPSIDTAATDGRSIRFNPDFCSKLTDSELTWLYAHEVAHPGLLHPWRIGHRNPEKFNIAADYVVNELLDSVITSTPGASRRLTRIKGTYLDPQYFGLSVEQIYDLLPDSPPEKPPTGTFTKPGKDPSESPGPSDTSSPSDSPSTPTLSDPLEAEWKQAAAQAATVARSRNRGQLPAVLESILRDLFEPAVPWQDILRQFASRICRDDYTFRRANRRYAHQGFILPSLRTESLGRIVCAVDTSGSIRCVEKLLTAFLTELQDILDTSRPEVLHLIDCDARVHSHTELRPGNDLRGTAFHGGGGTCFRPVFRFVEDRDLQPDCLIYFTDLEGSFPTEPPPYPVLWINYGSPRTTAPFGTTVQAA